MAAVPALPLPASRFLVGTAIARDDRSSLSRVATTTSSSRASSTRGCTASATVSSRACSRGRSRFNTGQVISAGELVARLNDVGYAERARVERPASSRLTSARSR